MKAVISALIVAAIASTAASAQPVSYSKQIVGRWLGSKKFIIFHSNGTWGVQRNEESLEDILGRRWHIDGRKLILVYPGDRGFETAVYTIVSFTPQKLVTEIDGHKEEYERSP